MNDYGYILADAIVALVSPISFQGTRQIPDQVQPALKYLEIELWRDLIRPGSLWSNIRVNHNGHDLHPSKYMGGRIGDGLVVHSHIDTDKVTAYLSDGATLIYNHLQESSRIVQRLQEAFEYLLDARVWIQAYLTRTSESAFGFHHDDHNFFALQVAGSKRWSMRHSPDAAYATEITTTPGTVIAAPSNTPHKVSGCGQLSLHLTVAFDWLSAQTRPGSHVPQIDLPAHRATPRIGGTLPLSLCPEMASDQLLFRFRDRVRPTIKRTASGVEIDCHAGQFLLDGRFAPITEALAAGRELTTADIHALAPQLSVGDIDKLLRFGIESEFLSCTG